MREGACGTTGWGGQSCSAAQAAMRSAFHGATTWSHALSAKPAVASVWTWSRFSGVIWMSRPWLAWSCKPASGTSGRTMVNADSAVFCPTGAARRPMQKRLEQACFAARRNTPFGCREIRHLALKSSPYAIRCSRPPKNGRRDCRWWESTTSSVAFVSAVRSKRQDLCCLSKWRQVACQVFPERRGPDRTDRAPDVAAAAAQE